jgi:hypothetical protein
MVKLVFLRDDGLAILEIGWGEKKLVRNSGEGYYGAREHSTSLYASFLSKNVICDKCMYTCIQILTQTRNYIVPVLRGAHHRLEER